MRVLGYPRAPKHASRERVDGLDGEREPGRASVGVAVDVDLNGHGTTFEQSVVCQPEVMA